MSSLERITAPNGVVIHRSTLLQSEGFRHGFGTRIGGVSAAPFDTLNLGIAQAPGEPDTDANVAENARRLMEAVGAPAAAMVRVRQVHGCTVHACTGEERFGPPGPDADALVSADPRVAPCIRTADCVPVLVGCTETGIACAIHAGWRGIVAGVVARAVEAMCARRDVRPGGMVAAIGPCIGAAGYEVGPEVAQAFAGAVGSAFVLPAGDGRAKEHIDCFGAVRSQLMAAGIPLESIDGTELCTVSGCGDFFSYRRDGARSGRLGAVIVPRG